MNQYYTNKESFDVSFAMKIAFILFLIISGISISYHFFVFKPSVEREKLAQLQEEKNKKLEKEKQLKECISNADKYFHESWDKWCENYGIDHMNSGCGLQEVQADRIHKIRKQDHEICFRLFNQKAPVEEETN